MYEIIGTYRGQKEVLDTAEDRKEAQYLRQEYQLAFGSEWNISIKRSKNGN
jgi:hypothetical protein